MASDVRRSINKIEIVDGIGDWETCGGDDLSQCLCVGEYRQFAKRMDSYARPISEFQLWTKIVVYRYFSQFLVNPVSTAEGLRSIVVESSRLDVVEKLALNSQMRVGVISEEDFADHKEIRFVVSDDYLRNLNVLALVPTVPVLDVGVLGFHGHNQGAHGFRDMIGLDLAKRGFLVVIPNLRAQCGGDSAEKAVTKMMLKKGLSAFTYRYYEVVLSLRLLDAWQRKLEIAEPKIAAIGHSGGSQELSVFSKHLVFDALIVDAESSYLPKELFFEQTLPELYPIRDLINDPRFSPTPTIKMRYGFVNEEGEKDLAGIVDFLHSASPQ